MDTILCVVVLGFLGITTASIVVYFGFAYGKKNQPKVIVGGIALMILSGAYLALAIHGIDRIILYGYPASPNNQLEANSVVKVIWSQPNPDETNFSTLIRLPDDNYRLFKTKEQVEDGWVKVYKLIGGKLAFVPFPIEEDSEPIKQ